MVPKVAARGRSFKGAGLYYLHDKKADTKERVAFTHTENLPTRDPDKAIKCMAWTTMRQNEIKARSGASTKGRKLTDPVYTYSLAWHPDQAPDREGMIEAAKASLKALGLEKHEALFVGHNDEPHPHVHVIVNRVNPETGIAAKLSKDFLTLSAWAEAYEKAHGKVWCEQRVINNELRRQGEFAKDRSSQHSAEFHRWRQARAEKRNAARQFEKSALFEKHQGERDALRGGRNAKLDGLRQRLRDQTRADWRDLYVVHVQERRRLEAAQRTTWARLRLFVRENADKFRTADRKTRREILKDAFYTLIGSQRQFAKLEDKQLRERSFFGRKLRERIVPATQQIREEFERELEGMRKRQARERHDQRFRHLDQVKKEKQERKSGKDAAEFEAEQKQAEKPSGANELRDKFRKAGQSIRDERERPGDSLRDKFRQAAKDKDEHTPDQPAPPRKSKRDRDREPD